MIPSEMKCVFFVFVFYHLTTLTFRTEIEMAKCLGIFPLFSYSTCSKSRGILCSMFNLEKCYDLSLSSHISLRTPQAQKCFHHH